MKEQKSVQKSIRMTPTVAGFVDKQEGDGFNEKFENMVLYFMKHEKELQDKIKSLEKREKDLKVTISAKTSILSNLETIQKYVSQAVKHSEM